MKTGTVAAVVKLPKWLNLRYQGRPVMARGDVWQIPDKDLSKSTYGKGGAPTVLSEAEGTQVPTAYACVNLLASLTARLPIEIRTRDGFRTLESHYVTSLFRLPHPHFSGFKLREILGWQLHVSGNAYAWIQRNAGGFGVRLHPAVLIRLERRGGRLMYTLGLPDPENLYATRHVDVTGADVLHVSGPGANLFTGIAPSPIQYFARHVLSIWAASMDHHGNSLRGGINANKVFSVDPKRFSDRQFKEVINALKGKLGDSIKENITGTLHAGEPVILLPGMNYQLTGFSSVDLQLLQIMKMAGIGVTQIYGIPPYLIQDHAQQSGGWARSNLSEQSTAFVKNTLASHLERWQQEIDRKLLMSTDFRRYQTIVNTDRFVLGSIAEIAKIAESLVQKSAVLTPNQFRTKYLGEPPMPGGDKLRQPTGAPPQDGGSGDSDEPPEPPPPPPPPPDE